MHCPKRCQKSVTLAITQPSCCSWHPLRSGMLNTLFKKKIRSLKRQCILHQSQCLISQVYRKRSKFSSNSSLVYSSETCYRTSIVKKSCNNRKAKVWPSSGHTQYTEHLLYSCCFLSEMCMQPFVCLCPVLELVTSRPFFIMKCLNYFIHSVCRTKIFLSIHSEEYQGHSKRLWY